MHAQSVSYTLDTEHPETLPQTLRLCALMLEQGGVNFRVYIFAAFREFGGGVGGKTAYERTKTWYWSRSPLLRSPSPHE